MLEMFEPDSQNGLTGRRLRCAVRCRLDKGANNHVLKNGHAREWPGDLKRSADSRSTNGTRLSGDQIEPLKSHVAGVRSDQAVHDVEERGLAGAVRTDNAEDFPGTDGKRDVAQSLHAAKAARNIVDSENLGPSVAGGGR